MSPTVKKAVLIAGAVAIVLILTSVTVPAPLVFRPKLATEVVPDLLTAIFVIAALSERAIAVINDIWFGERREIRQEAVRAKGKELEIVVAMDRFTLDTQAKVAVEAARSGKMEPLSATTMETVLPRPGQEVRVLTTALSAANEQLATVDGEVDRARLLLSFIAGLIVSFVGVRVLAPLFQGPTGAWFSLVDVVLTAGVLAGGTTAINAISELIGTFVNASRKRALEGSNSSRLQT